MTTQDEHALYAEILRTPDDLGPRRVLGDLLLQRGDPRGEFIQMQCDLDGKLDWALEERCRELLIQHATAWLPDFGTLATRPLFRRGFVEHVSCSAMTFLTKGAELVKLAPLRSLTLTGLSRVQDLERLLATPAIAQIRELEIHSAKLGKKHCQVLAASPILANLTRLALPGCTIGDHGAAALAGSKHLAQLRELILDQNAIETAGAEALAASTGLASVRHLDLSWNRFGARGVYPSMTSPNAFPSLTSLDLTACDLGGQGGDLVATSKARGKLERLVLARNSLDDGVARSLANASHYVNLRDLDLRGNEITADGLRAFVTTKLPALRSFLYDEAAATTELIAQLVARFRPV